eukprot:SAG11_NODE_20938_length_435_cov_1.017857_1_plen_84_part_10
MDVSVGYHTARQCVTTPWPIAPAYRWATKGCAWTGTGAKASASWQAGCVLCHNTFSCRSAVDRSPRGSATVGGLGGVWHAKVQE